MKIGNIDLPDKCPDNCVLSGDFGKYFQTSVCMRCPIFNCTGDFTVLAPEDYRHDWALIWEQWFKSDMDRLPVLPLEISGQK